MSVSLTARIDRHFTSPTLLLCFLLCYAMSCHAFHPTIHPLIHPTQGPFLTFCFFFAAFLLILLLATSSCVFGPARRFGVRREKINLEPQIYGRQPERVHLTAGNGYRVYETTHRHLRYHYRYQLARPPLLPPPGH